VQSAGWTVEEYDSGLAFLESGGPQRSICVLLDVRMPRLSGLAIQRRISADGDAPPIVFISAYADVPAAIEGIRGGAVHFLQKPCSEWEILSAIERAVAQGDEDRRQRQVVRRAQERLDRLSARQREVMALLMQGSLNKQIAAELGISERTVEVHRSACMAKLEVDSLVELVQLYLMVRAQAEEARPPLGH